MTTPKPETTALAAPWDRPLIGWRPFNGQVWCCGRTDEADILSAIVGWAVGSIQDRLHLREIEDLRARGFITTRRHRAPSGEWDAYRLTKRGFERLAAIGYGDMHDVAVKAHRFYAERNSI